MDLAAKQVWMLIIEKSFNDQRAASKKLRKVLSPMAQLSIMRLFIAIRLNEEMKDALIDVQNQMYDSGVRGNFSPEENLHLTLAFIGEYPDPENVMDALDTVSFTPFELSLNGVGSFGDIWWAGLNDNPALQAIVRRIRRALANAQISFDRKTFRPHITLIRKARVEYGMPEFSSVDAKMTVHTVSLMRSDRGKNGMIYTEIGTLEADIVDAWK